MTTQYACPAGTAQGASGQGGCPSCSPGYYNPYTAQRACTAAPPGSYVPGYRATGVVPCEVGKYQPRAGQSSCLPCPVGTYQPATGKTFCYDTSPGHYQHLIQQTFQFDCAIGTYQPLTRQIACLDTTPGHMAPYTAMPMQLDCVPGTFQPSTRQCCCIDAPAGSYNPNSAMSITLPCPPAYFTNETRQSACRYCERNTYTLGQRETVCMQCRNDPDCGDCVRSTGYPVPRPGYCAIGRSCIPKDAISDSNVCLTCSPAANSYAYTALTGATCSDGSISTFNDACAAGICKGTRASCLTYATTGSAISDCEIETGRGPIGCARRPTYLGCVHTSAAGVRSCGCSIDGACYAHGTRKPGNGCVACDVSVSVNEWTPAPPEPCDDGNACTYGDTCQLGVCRGTTYSCAAAGACLRNVTCDGRGGCALNLLPAGTQCAPAIDACTPASQCDGATAACPPRAVRLPAVAAGDVSLLEADGTLPGLADASGFSVLGASGGSAALVRLSDWSVPCGGLSFSVALAPVDASGALPRCSEAALAAAPGIGGDATPWGPELDVPFRALTIPNGTLVEAVVRARNIAGYIVAGCSGAALVDGRAPASSVIVNVRPGAVSPPPLLLDPPTITDAQLTGGAEAWMTHSGSSLAFMWEPFTAPDALLTWSGALEYDYAVGRGSTNASNPQARVALDDVIAWTPLRPRSPSARREAVDTGAAPLPQGVPLIVSVRGRTRTGASTIAAAMPVTLDAAGAAGAISVYDGIFSNNSDAAAAGSSGLSAAAAFAAGALTASWTLAAQPASGLDHWEVCFSTQASSCDVSLWQVLPPSARNYTVAWRTNAPPVSGVAYRAVVRAVARSGAIAQARSVGLTYDATPPQGLVWTLPPFLPSAASVTASFAVIEPESPINAVLVWIADVRASDPSNPGRRVFIPPTRVVDASINNGMVTIAFNTTPPGGLKVYWCGYVENAAGLRSETACSGAVADGTPPDAFTVTSVMPNANVAQGEDPAAPSAVHDGPSLRAIWSSSRDGISGIVAYELQAQLWTAATAASPAAWTAASAIFSTGSDERAFDFINVWRPAAPGTYRVRMLAVNGGGARTEAVSQPTIVDYTPPVLPAVTDGPFVGSDLPYVADAAAWSASWPGAGDAESGVTSCFMGVAACGSLPSVWVPVTPPNATAATIPLASFAGFSLMAGSPRYCTFIRLTNGAGLTTDVVSDGAVFDPTPPSHGSVSAGGALSSAADATAFVQPASRVVVTWTGLTDADSGVDVNLIVGSKPGLADLLPATAIPAAAVAASATSFAAAVCSGPGYCWVTLEARNGARVSTSATSNLVVLLLPPRAGAVSFVVPPSLMAMDAWALAASANVSLPVSTAISATADASRVAILMAGFGGGGVPVARFLLDLGSAPGGADIMRAFDNGPSPLAVISGLSLRQRSRVYVRATAVSAAGLSVTINGSSPLLVDTSADACGSLALHGVSGTALSGGATGALAWWADASGVTVRAQRFVAPVSGLAGVSMQLLRSPWSACSGAGLAASGACGSGEIVAWRRPASPDFDLGAANASTVFVTRLDSPDDQPLERGYRYRVAALVTALSGGSCVASTPAFALDGSAAAKPVVLPTLTALQQMTGSARAADTGTVLPASDGMLRNLRWRVVRSDGDAPFTAWSISLQRLDSTAASAYWITVNETAIALTTAPASGSGNSTSTATAAAMLSSTGDTLQSPSVALTWFTEDRVAAAALPLSLAAASASSSAAGSSESSRLAPGAYRLRLRGITASSVAVEAAPVTVVVDYTVPVAARLAVAAPAVAGLALSGGSAAAASGSSGIAGSTTMLQLTWDEATDAESGIAGYLLLLVQGAAGSTIASVALPPGSQAYAFNLSDSPLQQGGAYSVRLAAVNGANMTSVTTLALVVDTRIVDAGSVAVVRTHLCPAASAVSSAPLLPYAVASAVAPACSVSGGVRQLALPISVCGFALAGSGAVAAGDVTLVAWAGSAPNATDLLAPMILPPLLATNPTCNGIAVDFTSAVLSAVAPGAAAAACGSVSPLRGFTTLALPCGANGSAVFVSVRGINAAGASPVAISAAVQLDVAAANMNGEAMPVWQLAVGDAANGAAFAAGSSSASALTIEASQFAPTVFLPASTRTLQLAWTAPRPAGSAVTGAAACTSANPPSAEVAALCPGGLSHYEYAVGSSPGAANLMPRALWAAVQAPAAAATQGAPITASVPIPNGLAPGQRYFAAVRAVARGGDAVLVTHSAPFSLGAPMPTGGNITCATALDPAASLTVTFAGFTYVPISPTTLVFTACVAYHWDTPCDLQATATSELVVDRTANERPLQLSAVDVVITDLWNFRNILQDDVYVRGVVAIKGSGTSTAIMRPPHNLTVDVTPPGGIKQASLRLVRMIDDPASGEASSLPMPLEWPFLGAAPLSAYRLSMWNLSDAESGIAAVTLAVGFNAGGQQLQPFMPIAPIPTPPQLGFGGLLPIPGAILGGGAAVVVTLRVTNNALQTRQVSTPPIAVDATPPLPFTVATGAAPADPALLGYSGAVDSALRAPLDKALCHWSASADSESGLGYYLVALGGTPPAVATDAERSAWLQWTRVAPSAQSASLPLNANPPHGSRVYCSVKACNRAGDCTLAFDRIGSNVDRTPPTVATAAAAAVVWDGASCGVNTLVSTEPGVLAACWRGAFAEPDGAIVAHRVSVIALPSGAALVANRTVGADSSVRLTDLVLTEGRIYAIEVAAVNAAGAASRTLRSRGAMVDTQAPALDAGAAAGAAAFAAAAAVRESRGSTRYSYTAAARAELPGRNAPMPLLSIGAAPARTTAAASGAEYNMTLALSLASAHGASCIPRRPGEVQLPQAASGSGALSLTTTCAPGWQRSAALGVCVPCPHGFVKAAAGEDGCRACPWEAAHPAASKSLDGPAIAPVDARSDAAAACPCPSALHWFSADAHACVCRPGFVVFNSSAAGAGAAAATAPVACTACPAGTFKAVPGNSAVLCAACPAGTSSVAGSPACACPVPGFVFDAATRACVCPAGAALTPFGACERCPAGAYKPRPGAESVCLPCPWATTSSADGTSCTVDQTVLAGGVFVADAPGGGAAACPPGSVLEVSLSGSVSAAMSVHRVCRPCGPLAVQPLPILLRSESNASASAGVCTPCGGLGAPPVSLAASATDALYADWSALFSDASSGIDYYELSLGTVPGGAQVAGPLRFAANATSAAWPGLLSASGLVGVPVFASVRAVDRGGLVTSFVDPAPVMWDPTGPWLYPLLDGVRNSTFSLPAGFSAAAAINTTAVSMRAPLLPDADGVTIHLRAADDVLAALNLSSNTRAGLPPLSGEDLLDTDYVAETDRILAATLPPADTESGIASVLSCLGSEPYKCDVLPAAAVSWDATSVEAAADVSSGSAAAARLQRPTFDALLISLRSQWALSSRAASAAASGAAAQPLYATLWAIGANGMLAASASDGVVIAPAGPQGGVVWDGPGDAAELQALTARRSTGSAVAVADASDADCMAVGAPLSARWHGFASDAGGIDRFLWGAGSSPGAFDWLPLRDVGVATSASAPWVQPGPGSVVFSTVVAIDRAGVGRAVVSDGVSYVCGSGWRNAANATARSLCAFQASNSANKLQPGMICSSELPTGVDATAGVVASLSASY